MAQFEAAGLPRREVLRIATAEAVRFLGAEDDFGRVDVGLAADLLLVEANPVEDMATLASPIAVVAGGTRVR